MYIKSRCNRCVAWRRRHSQWNLPKYGVRISARRPETPYPRTPWKMRTKRNEFMKCSCFDCICLWLPLCVVYVWMGVLATPIPTYYAPTFNFFHFHFFITFISMSSSSCRFPFNVRRHGRSSWFYHCIFEFEFAIQCALLWFHQQSCADSHLYATCHS